MPILRHRKTGLTRGLLLMGIKPRSPTNGLASPIGPAVTVLLPADIGYRMSYQTTAQRPAISTAGAKWY